VEIQPTTQQTHLHKPISISFLISSFLASEIGAPSWAEISVAPPWAEIGAPRLQQRRGLEKMGEKRREKGEREKADRGKKKKKA
jgi:hypothetical protein